MKKETKKTKKELSISCPNCHHKYKVPTNKENLNHIQLFKRYLCKCKTILELNLENYPNIAVNNKGKIKKEAIKYLDLLEEGREIVDYYFYSQGIDCFYFNLKMTEQMIYEKNQEMKESKDFKELIEKNFEKDIQMLMELNLRLRLFLKDMQDIQEDFKDNKGE